MNQDQVDLFVQTYPTLARSLTKASQIPRTTLRSYPRILEKLNLIWGTRDGHLYLEGLLLTEHERNHRAGFADAVVAELIRLQGIHIYQYPGTQTIDENDPYSMVVGAPA